MKKRSVFAFAVASLMAALCMVSLSSCGLPVAEGMIARNLSERLDSVKHADEKITDSMLGDASREFRELNIDPKEFAKSFFEAFDYKIEDIEIDGDTATAHVSINCKQLQSFIGHLVVELGSNIKGYSDMGNYAKLKNLMRDSMMKAIKDTETKKTDCTFIYHRGDDGTWNADSDKARDALAHAMGINDTIRGMSSGSWL
ncbi:hypothetical protein Corgl_0038 [Coriobacterium glomerans PW2]|uniref:Lipoprotein n=1 Tax=Coriobacterium glomerans (strain ATCC 49209 / DSM 20642 / JCM 10262 / PW2) TaxID=700015 RepID=F2N6W8_CORGP|nr:hypothetical protein [Coriobacterium glomerans]AEB06167.1 hypothetical protein Corgl_0038 [Coriobacterium glomerans PW2]